MTNSSYPGLIPSYEHQRLAALEPYQVLGTPGQGLFNDFVSVVAKLFEVPIALISLVREDDVVFVGNEGLPEAPTANREDSMCSVAILNDGLTVFEDLTTQPCHLVNPFAAQQLRLGFYAGQSLRTSIGMPLGSLCVIDRRPRQLAPLEGELLTQLALVAQDLLEVQAADATNGRLGSALRPRLDAVLQPSLTRLNTLAELRKLDPDADAADLARYTDSRLDEARYLAQALHRELQAVLNSPGR